MHPPACHRSWIPSHWAGSRRIDLFILLRVRRMEEMTPPTSLFWNGSPYPCKASKARWHDDSKTLGLRQTTGWGQPFLTPLTDLSYQHLLYWLVFHPFLRFSFLLPDIILTFHFSSALPITSSFSNDPEAMMDLIQCGDVSTSVFSSRRSISESNIWCDTFFFYFTPNFSKIRLVLEGLYTHSTARIFISIDPFSNSFRLFIFVPNQFPYCNPKNFYEVY